MMGDRRVHAQSANGAQVVRYNRAGKWYLEWPAAQMKPRQPVSLTGAVEAAVQPGSTVYQDIHGGSMFDARVRAAWGVQTINSPEETPMTTETPAPEALDANDLIGPKEAASIFGVAALTVARWGRDGKVPTIVMPNGRRVFSRAYCENYMAQRRIEA